MATSKTLAPTNVTISIPAMTDQPNASVLANCADKEADAINALNSQITNKLSFKGVGIQANASATVTLSTSGRYKVTTIGPNQTMNSITNIRVDGAGNLGVFPMVTGSSITISSSTTNVLTIANGSGSAINAYIEAYEGTIS